MDRTTLQLLAAGTALVVTAACSDAPTASAEPFDGAAMARAAAPSPLVAVTVGDRTRSIWPFTGRDFAAAADPINLLFVGAADPVALRAALIALDGDRSAFGFPAAPPFDCTWADAIGGVQTSYTAESGWSGSAVQLDCGGYGPLRFHLRLFDADEWTLGGAHFEVLIPGTADHEVLGWELAEQLVLVDFLRAGVLDPAMPFSRTPPITPSPVYRTINPLVYNGLPAALIGALGTPPPPAAAPVPIPNDGRATIVFAARAREPEPSHARSEFVITYDQVVPRPFCAAGPADHIHVSGPVRLSQGVAVTPSGEYVATSSISGSLVITPVDPTMTPPAPTGPSRQAEIDRATLGSAFRGRTLATELFRQMLSPGEGLPRQSSLSRLAVGSDVQQFERSVRCD